MVLPVPPALVPVPAALRNQLSVKGVAINGVLLPAEPYLNFITGVTGVDNPNFVVNGEVVGSLDLTVEGGGGGGGVTGTGLWYSTSSALNPAAVGFSGDVVLGALSGGNIPTTVAKIQNQPVLNSVPSSANLFIYNTGTWVPTAITGDVSLGANGATTVKGLQNQPVSVLTPGSANVLVYNTGGAGWVPTTISKDISINASGLATLVAIDGTALPAPTGTGTILTFTGSALTWGAAGGSGINQLLGDVLAGPGTGAQTGVVVGIRGVSVPSPSGSNTNLQYNAGAFSWAPSPSGVTWANDLPTSSNTHQYVSGISGGSGMGGLVTLSDGSHNLSLTMVSSTVVTAPNLTITGAAAFSTNNAGSVTITGGGATSAYAGNVSLLGGAGVTGGNVNLTGGSGEGEGGGVINITGGSDAAAGEGGGIILTTGANTNGFGISGSITLQTPNVGTNLGSSGNIFITGGSGCDNSGPTGNSGSGTNLYFTSGDAGSQTGTSTTTPAAAGAINFTTGSGGASTSATSGAANGGDAGGFSWLGGNGGQTLGTAAQVAGNGGGFSWTGGQGGQAPNSADANAGNGGGFIWIAGDGGVNGDDESGSPGSFWFQSGNIGAADGALSNFQVGAGAIGGMLVGPTCLPWRWAVTNINNPSTSYSLSNSQASNFVITIQGSLSGDTTVIFPGIAGDWIVNLENLTLGIHTLKFSNGAGNTGTLTSSSVTSTKNLFPIHCDGPSQISIG